MKAYKILIFIFSVIIALGMLCSFFPRGGVRIGPVSLEFPSLEDILIGEAEDNTESPEELLARRQEAMKEAQKNNFLAYFENDPAKFHMPQGDLTYFDEFFEALDGAVDEHIRIVHYGDSQIEEDRVSGVIRDSLQTRFGGGGPGLVPVLKKYYTLNISESCSTTPSRYMVYGPAEMRAGNGRYGVMGQKTHFDSTSTVSFLPVKSNLGPDRYFNRLTLLTSGGKVYVNCKGQKQQLEASQDVRHARFELPDSTTRVSVSFSGSHDVYGIMLDNDKGVSLDNIPMRGCSGTIFTSISSAQLSDFYVNENVRLIILQYGGNTMPYMKTDKSISQYRVSIEKQINHIRSQAPDAKILFIGPSDMSTNIQGKMQTYPHLPTMVDSLRTAANNAGAAYWDMYAAMGGSGSMAKWVKEVPALAGSDYVHFTPLGAEKMGGMLYESLMLYYEYYKLRKK